MNPVRQPRADIDPSLSDVVPWNVGYAHSWALAALLNHPLTRSAVLDALDGLPGPGPHRVAGPVRREKAFGPARADLAFTLVDAAGEGYEVAVETKVNDPFAAAQVQAYRDAGCVPILYLPAGTGILLAAAPITSAGEIRLLPDALLAALDATDLTFSPLMQGYIDDLRGETVRADRALALARGSSLEPIGPGRSNARALSDFVWIAEVIRAIPHAARGSGVGPNVRVRIEANDRGFFYTDSFSWLDNGGALWVDLLAEVRTGKRSVAIKAGEANLPAAYDLAVEHGPPRGAGWRRTARRITGSTCSVWKIDLDRSVNARQAADAAVRAAGLTRSLAA